MALTLGASACAGERDAGQPSDGAGGSPTGAAETAEMAALGQRVRGTILPGPPLAFRACGEEGSTPLQPVDLYVRSLLDEITTSGQPVYAEFMARVGGRVPTMTMTRLIHAAWETAGCANPAPDYDFIAHGNEPFWRVEVRGDEAVWITPDQPEGTRFDIAEREEVGKGWLLGAAGDPAPLALSFAATPCRDSMADAWYGYTVQAEMDGTVFHGCGRVGIE